MKWLTKRNLWLSLVAAFIALTAQLNGCGTKNNNNGTNTGIPTTNCVGYNCPNGMYGNGMNGNNGFGVNGQMMTLGSAMGYSQSGFVIELGLYGQGGGSYAGSFNGYSGQVMAQGILTVMQYIPSCPIQPGQYQIQSVQPGQWSGNMFSNLLLQTTNGYNLQIQMVNNSIQSISPVVQGPSGNQYSYRIIGNMLISACPQMPFAL